MNQIGRLVTELLEGRMEAAGPLHDLLVNEQCPPGQEHRAVRFQVTLSYLAYSLFTIYNRFSEVSNNPTNFQVAQSYRRIRSAKEEFDRVLQEMFFFDLYSPTEILPVLTSQLAFTGLPPEPVSNPDEYESIGDGEIGRVSPSDNSISPFSGAE